MKNLVALVLLASAVAMPVFADDSGMAANHKMMVDKMFKDADTNNDGYISKDEFMNDAQKKFDMMDSNHDGKLSHDEVMAFKKNEHDMMKSSMGSPTMNSGSMAKSSNNTKTNSEQ